MLLNAPKTHIHSITSSVKDIRIYFIRFVVIPLKVFWKRKSTPGARDAFRSGKINCRY